VSGLGHAPAGFTAFGAHPDFKFGTVSYDEPLSREQQEHYSLVDLSQTPREIAQHVAAELQEYAAEYIQEAEDSPRDFEIAVGQRIDRMNVHAKREAIAPLVLRILKGEIPEEAVAVRHVPAAPVAPRAPVAPAPRASRAPRAPRAPRASSFKPKGGEWVKISPDLAVLHLEDHKGRSWDVTADRDGRWRVRTRPRDREDDDRAYGEGNVDEDLPSRERFTAAKKAGRKYLTDLLMALSEEG
jgi:hypothetical protein